MKDDLVVQRSAKQRMRMTNQGCMRRILCTGVEERFKTSNGTFEEERADCRVRGKHSLDYMRDYRSKKSESGTSLFSLADCNSGLQLLLFSLPWMLSRLRGS